MQEKETLAELLDLDSLPEPEIETWVEPPKPRDIHRCPQGHEQAGSGESIAYHPETRKPFAKSGPVCVACMLEDMGNTYPTAPAPQAE